MKTEKIKITTEYIKLDQLLKFAGITASGAEAKQIITDGLISVNKEICTARGKKIYDGDRVLVGDTELIIEGEKA